MKLATFVFGGVRRVGIVHEADGKLFDLARAAERDGGPDDAFGSMLSLIDSGDEGLERAALLFLDRKSTRLNSSHCVTSRMPSSA